MGEAALPRHYRTAEEELLLPTSPSARLNPFTPSAITTIVLTYYTTRDLLSIRMQNAKYSFTHSSSVTALFCSGWCWIQKLSPGHWALAGIPPEWDISPLEGTMHTHAFTSGAILKSYSTYQCVFKGVGENQKTQRKPMGTPQKHAQKPHTA